MTIGKSGFKNLCAGKLACVAWVMLCFLSAPTNNSLAFESYGRQTSFPLQVVNQTPMQLLFFQPYPDVAETLPRGSTAFLFQTSLTNTLLYETRGGAKGRVDMEILRWEACLKVGLTDRLEMGITMPISYTYKGILDEFIEGVEEIVGWERTVRVHQNPYEYSYCIKKGEKSIVCPQPDSPSGLGDLSLMIKALVAEERGWLPSLSIRLGVSVPTGDRQRALGSGRWNFGLGLLAQKGIGRAQCFLNLDIIFPDLESDAVELDLEEFYHVMLGAELPFGPRLSGVGQLRYLSRPFKDTGLDMLERRIFDLLVGVNWRLSPGFLLQVGVTEDLFDSGSAGADVTFFVTLGYMFQMFK